MFCLRDGCLNHVVLLDYCVTFNLITSDKEPQRLCCGPMLFHI
jgi:hypothetical protein